MPVKKKVDKRKKPKQKQKQKQIVKQNVKVTVQSSGGSGGGGTGSPFPQSVPQPFTDKSGENVRLQNLIQQISRKVRAPVMESNDLPIPTNYPAPRYNSSNDSATLNDVFNDPINNTSGFTAINGDKIETIPKARKVRSDAGSSRKPKITIMSESESEGYSSRSVFPEPMGFPSQSMLGMEMRAKQKLMESEPDFM